MELRSEFLHVEGAEEHTLKSVSASLPRLKMTICTGPSGSGKSSFAFDTVYAESQRRYSEALSPYARSLISLSPKPKVERIFGLPPAIAIEQKSHEANPRSTVGTLTEIYDSLRILYAYMGTAFCPETGDKIESITKEFIVKQLLALPHKSALTILSPLSVKHSFAALKQKLQAQGFLRIELNGILYSLDEEIPYDARRQNALYLVVDRLVLTSSATSRLREAVTLATSLSSGTVLVKRDGETLFFNEAFAVSHTGRSYSSLTPHSFSFNVEQGMCLECRGLGVQYGAKLLNHSSIAKLSPYQLFLYLCKGFANSDAMDFFSKCMHMHKIPLDQPIKTCTVEQQQILFAGEKEQSPFRWIGLNVALESIAKNGKSTLRNALQPLLEETLCTACEGSRLNPLARNVSIQGMRIGSLCKLPIDQMILWMQKLKDIPSFLEEAHAQICNRLYCLQQLGIGYLSIDRSAATLSGGEMQRVRLAKQLGSGLTGCLYVLDEPTIGLHPRDTAYLHNALGNLLRMGNTLLLIEHDPLTIQRADFLLDFGPRAGKEGGYITARGSPSEILQNDASLTGAYLNGKKQCPFPSARRKGTSWFTIQEAKLHNLKNLSLKIPIGIFVCITGVSGSGKSTLVGELIQPAIAKAIAQRVSQITIEGALFEGLDAFEQLITVNSSPLGASTRANISTYTELLTPLRQFFSQLPEARAKGLTSKHFSWYQQSGMCTTCFGQGTKRIYLQYLPPVHLMCPACNGHRLNPQSLSITYKGKHIGQLLELNVKDAIHFLPKIPKMQRVLQSLLSVGLDYISLGQELATLSSGEAQRVKLARELAKRAQPKTLYLFDEPTLGLHADDIARLIPLLHAIVDQGHSIIVIEHNLDIMAQADWIIDIGPESGERGGEIVATGTPEQIVTHSTSHTAKALRSQPQWANASAKNVH